MPFISAHAARLEEPEKFLQNSFRIKKIANGINFVLGKKAPNGAMQTQSIRFDKDKFSPMQAHLWLQQNHYSPILFEPAMKFTEQPTTQIQILKEGTFTSGDGNDYTFTKEDLQDIAKTYNEQPIEDRHDAPLNPDDHDETEPLLNEDGSVKLDEEGNPVLKGKPAMGYVKDLVYKVIDGIGALFADVLPTPELIQGVKDNKYKKVSAMFYPDNKLLRHVAILGEMVPAVKGLGMLHFSEAEIENLKSYEEHPQFIDETYKLITRTYNNLFIKLMEGKMPQPIDLFQVDFIKKLTEATSSDVGAKAQALFEELKPTYFDPNAETPEQEKAEDAAETPEQKKAEDAAGASATEAKFAEELKKVKADYEKRMNELEKKNRTMEFTEYFSSQKGRLVPAQKNLTLAILEMANEKKEIMFTEGTVKLNGIDTVKKFIESFPENKAMFTEFAKSAEADNNSVAQKDAAISDYIKNRNASKIKK